MLKDEQVGADVLEQLPGSLRQQMDFERFHLHKAELYQNRARDPAFDPKYLPQNCGAMALPCYWIERRHLYVFGAQSHADELGFFSGPGPDDTVLFPMHPTSVAHYQPWLDKVAAKDVAADGLRIWAVPTASMRTLLAWPDEMPERAVFVKVSLHSRILGDRRLHTAGIARSVGLSALVREVRQELPEDFDFYPENFGFVPRRMPDSGVIVRSIPERLKTDRLMAVPLFALIGGQHAQPLFLQLMEQARVQPLEFLDSVICSRFARLWLELSLRHGLILEAHGQDLMLATSPDLRTVDRIHYRDFEGLQVDWELRRRQGWSTPSNLPGSHAWREAYAGWGARYGQLAWYKLRMSLVQYLYHVLIEFEQTLRSWQARGLMGGARIEEHQLTAMFSSSMLELIYELYSVRMRTEYNIHQHLDRFVLLLMRVRKELTECDSRASLEQRAEGVH